MNKFLINGTKTESIEQLIWARDRTVAAQMFKYKYPDHHFDYVGADRILGWCENTDVPIFEGDKHVKDENGIMWLKD